MKTRILTAILTLMSLSFAGAQVRVGLMAGTMELESTDGVSTEQADLEYSFLTAGYEFDLGNGLRVVPEVSLLLGLDFATFNVDSESGYSIGVTGEYDLVDFGSGRLSALGSLDFSSIEYNPAPQALTRTIDTTNMGLGIGYTQTYRPGFSGYSNLTYVSSLDGELEIGDNIITLDHEQSGLELGFGVSFSF